jgi:hypothetical protein
MCQPTGPPMGGPVGLGCQAGGPPQMTQAFKITVDP